MRTFAAFATSSIAAGKSEKSAAVANRRPTPRHQRSTISMYVLLAL
jgi:hypothetical protein